MQQLTETSSMVMGADLSPLGTTCSCTESWGCPSSQDPLLQCKWKPLYLWVHHCLQLLKVETMQGMIWGISSEGKRERGELGPGFSPLHLF